ncbi:MAG: hypothetical protein ABSF15_28320 [Candidatus Sulfotelmatobacter sp.]|jgi:hypothetical protein
MTPKISEIESPMSDWSIEELRAFFCCVRAGNFVSVPDTREDLVVCSNTELFWAYNSRTTAQAKQSADELREKMYNRSPERMKTDISKPQPAKELHEYGSVLSYEYLLREVCKTIKIGGFNIESLPALEVYLISCP